MDKKIYDCLIIGAGPAGLTSAIYAVRGGLDILLFENKMVGGQISLTNEIKNYPGFKSINGMELAMLMHDQAEQAGAKTVYEQISNIDTINKIVTTTKKQYKSKTIIFAMGARAKRLGVENEERLIGAGVAYCAFCDGAFYKDKNVLVVGGGNTAVEDAIYLSKIAKSVKILNIHNKFKSQDILLDELERIIEERKNIQIYYNHEIIKICGDTRVEKVIVLDKINNKELEFNCDGIFVSIGRMPDTDLIKNQVITNEDGYIVADETTKTSVEGIFVAGDIRVKPLRQVVTACADGAIAATEANSYINNMYKKHKL